MEITRGQFLVVTQENAARLRVNLYSKLRLNQATLGTTGTVGSGSAGIGMNFSDASGTEAAIGFLNSSDTGFYVVDAIGARNLYFETNNSIMGQVSSAGAWTIGASGGTQTHAVNGSVAITADSKIIGRDIITSSANPSKALMIARGLITSSCGITVGEGFTMGGSGISTSGCTPAFNPAFSDGPVCTISPSSSATCYVALSGAFNCSAATSFDFICIGQHP